MMAGWPGDVGSAAVDTQVNQAVQRMEEIYDVKSHTVPDVQ